MTYLEERKAHDEEFMKKNIIIPQELVEEANGKLAGLIDLTVSIDLKMMKVQEALDEIRQVVMKNIKSEHNMDGYFRQGEAEYLACLELKSAQLESLFYKDHLQLAERATAEKKKAEAFNNHLKEVVEKQSRELAAILRSKVKLESMLKPVELQQIPAELKVVNPPIGIVQA